MSKRFHDICEDNEFDYFLRVCFDSPLLDMSFKIKFKHLNKYKRD